MSEICKDTRVLEFFENAKSTAIYPGAGTIHGLEYISLGLFEESGEVCGKLKKALRDRDGQIDREAFQKELGDVCWYVAQLVDCLPWKDLDAAVGSRAPLLNGEGKWSAVLGYLEHRLQRHRATGADAGFTEISLVAKKLARDASDVGMSSPKEITALSVSMLLNGLAFLAAAVGSDLGSVMLENTRKLSSRKARGVLGGSGDNR